MASNLLDERSLTPVSSDDDNGFYLLENEEDWSESDIEEFKKAVENTEKKMSVICCGPTGAGKSTLLNGLMGTKLWSEDEESGDDNGLFHTEESLTRGTLDVSEKIFTRNGVEVTVWDTPGLEGNTNDEEYLQEIKSKCANFDIFLYCIDGMEVKATDLFDEKSSLAKFTKIFGVELWKNAVVVLTLANVIEDDLIQKKKIEAKNDYNIIDVNTLFRDKVFEWKARVRAELTKLGVNKKRASKVPVLPAGIFRDKPLAGDSYWLDKIYNKMIDRMKHNSRIAYLQLMVDQQFSLKTREKVASGVLSSATGAGSAAAGAAVGATIGALLIGIPSFGVFAGLGLALGGLIGGGTGVGSAAAIATAFRYYKKKRHARKVKKCKLLLEKHN